MKIKLDFITNSSSVCYIVVIPPELKCLESLDGIRDWDEDGDTEEKALAIINDNISELKINQGIYNNENQLFWATQRYLEDQGFVLTSTDGAGGDGCDSIQPISINQLQGALNKCKRYED